MSDVVSLRPVRQPTIEELWVRYGRAAEVLQAELPSIRIEAMREAVSAWDAWKAAQDKASA